MKFAVTIDRDEDGVGAASARWTSWCVAIMRTVRLSLAISSNTIPLVNLTTIADEQVRRQLESVSGVGEVRLAGGLEREIRVNLVPAQLEALGVTVPEVLGALQRQNLEVPAGRVEQGPNERIVRVTGRITDASQFSDVIVATRGDQPVRLSDVARVELGNEEERSGARFPVWLVLMIIILAVTIGIIVYMNVIAPPTAVGMAPVHERLAVLLAHGAVSL